MGAVGTRLQAIEIGADVRAGQVQHLAPAHGALTAGMGAKRTPAPVPAPGRGGDATLAPAGLVCVSNRHMLALPLPPFGQER